MALNINPETIETQITDAHTIALKNKAKRAESAFALLQNYNFNGVGGMPNVSWTSPAGPIFEFNPGAYSELVMDGVVYSSLSTEQKQIFFKYLPKFIVQCMKDYDHAYSL